MFAVKPVGLLKSAYIVSSYHSQHRELGAALPRFRSLNTARNPRWEQTQPLQPVEASLTTEQRRFTASQQPRLQRLPRQEKDRMQRLVRGKQGQIARSLRMEQALKALSIELEVP